MVALCIQHHTASVADATMAQRRHAVDRQQRAGQVEGVRAGQGHLLRLAAATSDLGQQIKGVGKGKLLARQPRHEAPSDHEAPGLEASQGAHHLPPGDPEGFAAPQLPQHDPPALQELPGHALGGRLLVVEGIAILAGLGQERPASLTEPAADGRAASGPRSDAPAGPLAGPPTGLGRQE